MEVGADLLSADDADEESGLYCASTFEKASFPPQISEFLDPVPPEPPINSSPMFKPAVREAYLDVSDGNKDNCCSFCIVVCALSSST